MKKKLTALCLTVVMVLGLVLPVGAAAHFIWQQEPDLQQNKTTFLSVAADNQVYIIGGSIGVNAYEVTNQLEIYDTKAGVSRFGQPMTNAREHSAGGIIDGKIYVAGGRNQANTVPVSYLEIYDISQDQWMPGENMPTATYCSAAVAYNGELYVIGGAPSGSAATATKTMQIYNPATDEWRYGPEMPTARAQFYAAVYNDQIYVFGGRTATAGSALLYYSKVEIFDLKSNRWLADSEINVTPARPGFIYTGAIHEGKVYLYSLDTDDRFSIYDIEKNEWQVLPLPQPDKVAGYIGRLAVVNDRLYTLGGSAVLENLGVKYNYVYSLDLADKLYVLLDIAEEVQLSLDYSLTINPDYNWTSTDTSVAIVDSMGNVTAIGEGTCYIECRSTDGTYADYIPVKVIEGAPEIRLAVHLTDMDSTKRLWIHDPATAVTWTSLSPSVATVDNMGKVTAVDKGLAIIKGEIGGREYHIYVRVSL